MRIHTVVSVFILVFASLIISNFAVGQTKQNVVIGIGLGIHGYSDSDDVRQNYFLDEPTAGGVGKIFGEWYPFESIGIGFHAISIGSSETFWIFGVEFENKINITSSLITAQFIPYVSGDGYYRFGLIGGAGSSTYEYSLSNAFGSVAYETTGTAVLAGGYVDWGGESFGARFGLNVLSTSFDGLDISTDTGLNADGSGTHWYFDLRWAFQ